MAVLSSLLLSRLDYCNAVHTGLTASTLAPLQRVLHAAARVVMDLRPRDHAADVPGRPALRTASRGDFIGPRTNRKFGDRAFCVAAPRVWNRLPADLRQLRSTQTFRRHLKTFLFAASY